MKKLFLWASVILVCYFAADAARVPPSASGVLATARTIGQ
jgi:hypothetical protein